MLSVGKVVVFSRVVAIFAKKIALLVQTFGGYFLLKSVFGYFKTKEKKVPMTTTLEGD